ncbi:MAG: hypothetical protein JXB36_08260, partial [Gammaproteobacteria bacterium]|nr:hypothetical protein [Gammaproteobacteria bacterium]
GLGVVAGFSVAINVFVLKLAERYPTAPLAPVFPAIWIGFTLALVSGVLLLIAYPTKALTDWVFYLKIALIVAALAQLQRLRRRVFGSEASGGGGGVGDAAAEPGAAGARGIAPAFRDPALRASAVLAIALWVGAVVAGRFLAYTYEYLTAADLLGGL